MSSKINNPNQPSQPGQNPDRHYTRDAFFVEAILGDDYPQARELCTMEDFELDWHNEDDRDLWVSARGDKPLVEHYLDARRVRLAYDIGQIDRDAYDDQSWAIHGRIVSRNFEIDTALRDMPGVPEGQQDQP